MLTPDARITMVADRRQQLSGAIASVRLGPRARPARRRGRRPDHLVPVPSPAPLPPVPAEAPVPAEPLPAEPVPAAAGASPASAAAARRSGERAPGELVGCGG